MPPPPADSFASRLFLAPALRTQPDRRLVALVRDGYETAFEEIVRRYRAPLERFAAAIVGSRSEDVTQDAFSKALLALRGSENEIELRPWLYRIVRNTALNDLRDSPPPTEELGEAVGGGPSAAAEAERREELSDLTERLRALPETQRAAIVMRELEGLSHEEIAAALGLSGGAARQAIHRARTTLRDGVGLLLPLPLLKLLLDGGGEAAAAGAAGVAGAGGSAAALGGIGAAGAAKIGVAAVLVASSVGAGVAVEQSNRGGDSTRPAATSTPLGDDSLSGGGGPGRSSGELEPGDDHGGRGEAEPGDDHGGRGEGEHGDDRGRGGNRGRGSDDSGNQGRGGGDDSGPSGSSGPGSGGSGSSDSSDRSGSSGSGHSGSSGGSGSSGTSGGSGSGSSGSDDSGSGSSGSGGGDS